MLGRSIACPCIVHPEQGVPSTCQVPQDSRLTPAPCHALRQLWPQQAFRLHSGIFFSSDENRWRDREGNAAQPWPGALGSEVGREPELIPTPAGSALGSEASTLGGFPASLTSCRELICLFLELWLLQAQLLLLPQPHLPGSCTGQPHPSPKGSREWTSLRPPSTPEFMSPTSTPIVVPAARRTTGAGISEHLVKV